MSNCFKSDFKAANTSLLGKNDYKKVREKLLDEYPKLTKKSLERVFSAKEEINVIKCSNGTTLYVTGEKPPSFFDDGFGNLYPTLFTLWKIPHMMEELVTHGPVSKFLLPRDRSAGADMMLPGVIVPESGLGAVHVGQKRCVRVEGNDMPFAVGKMVVSESDITAKGMKGKGMAVLHVYRDSLWAYGGRKVPNEGFGADEIQPATTAERPSGQAEPIDLDEADAEEDEDEDEAERGERKSGLAEALPEMPPDELIEYCFFAALKSSCTDDELPITADRFYSHHMQPARPAGQPLLDAKKTSFKQIGKFIKHMHKQKLVVVREVKNEIKILSVDRRSKQYVSFEATGGASTKEAKMEKEAEAQLAGGGPKEEEIVRLRFKPPVITEMWQPNSYTKALFEAVGYDKNQAHAKEECVTVLRRYIESRLGPPSKMCAPLHGASAGGEDGEEEGEEGEDGARRAVLALLARAAVKAERAQDTARSLAAEGFDSLRAMEAGLATGSLTTQYLQSHHALTSAEATQLSRILAGDLPSEIVERLRAAGLSAEEASSIALTLASDGFDSLKALQCLTAAEAMSYGVPAASVEAFLCAEAGAATAPVNMEAVPLDDLLIDSLVKLAGGAKRGTTFPSHLPLAELQSRMLERMTQMHRVEVEGEAPAIKKGALKPIKIEMKRAAGHNKTHVSGLESLLIAPDAVSQVLKVKLGCTTAVIKLPGNNVKEQEIVLQGHCVNEVVDYLREAYCVDRQWIDLGKELDKKGKKMLAPTL